MLPVFLLFFLTEWESAVEAFKHGLYAPALYSIENLLLKEEFVKKDSAYFLAAEASFYLEKYTKAAIYYKKFLTVAYNDSLKRIAVEKMIRSFLLLKSYNEAFEALMEYQYLKISLEILITLAQKLEEIGEKEKAAKIYLKAGRYKDYVKASMLLKELEKSKESLKILNEAEIKFPQKKQEIQFLKYKIYLLLRDTLNALNTLLSITTPSSLKREDQIEAGKFLYALNLYEFSNVFLEGTNSPLLINVLMKLKNYKKAKELLKKDKNNKKELEKVKCLLGEKCDYNVIINTQLTPEEALLIFKRLMQKEEYTIAEKFINKIPLDWRSFKYKAEFYYIQGKYDSALFYYKRFMDFCVFSNYRNEVKEKIFEIENFKIKDANKALKYILKANTVEEKAYAIIKYAKDYIEAIKLIDTLSTSYGLYLCGLCYCLLWKKDKTDYYREQSHDKFEELFWEYSEDTLAEYALYYLFETEKDTLQKYEYGLDYIDHYPEGKFRYEIMYKLALIDLSKGDTASAYENFNIIYLSPKNRFSFPSLYMMAMIEEKEDTFGAIEKLELIEKLSSFPDSLYILSLYRLALLYRSLRNNVKAFSFIKKLAKLLKVLPDTVFMLAKEISEDIENPYIFKNIEITQETQKNYFKFMYILKQKIPPEKKILKFLKIVHTGFTSEFYYFLALNAEKSEYNNIAIKGYKIVLKYPARKEIIKKSAVALSEIFLQKNIPAEALAILEKMSHEFPTDNLILSRFVVALYRTGNITKADSLWEILDKNAFIDTSPLLLEKVAYYVLNNKFEEADSVLKFLQRFRKMENNKKFIYYKGLVKFKKGNFKEAIVSFKKFISKFPNDPTIPEIYFKLGSSFYQMQKFDSAVAYYKKASEYPEYVKRKDALFNIAVIYKQQEKWNKLIDISREIEKLSLTVSEKAKVYYNIGYAFLQKRNPLDALKYFKKALELATDRTMQRDIIYWLGETYFALGQYQNAIKEFLKIPEFGNVMWGGTALWRVGIIYELLEEYNKAKEIYKRIIKLYGEHSMWGAQAKERLKELELK